jgi:hypothetical protein
MNASHCDRSPVLKRLPMLLAPLVLAACASTTSLVPFTTDGCSFFPNRSPSGTADWCDCCLAHDLAYWRGGAEGDRLEADQALKTCVEQTTKNHALAETMYLGVRAGGGPQVDTPFRWGYGWPHGRGYQALTASESAAVKGLEDAYRIRNPTLQCKADAAAAAPRRPVSLDRTGDGDGDGDGEGIPPVQGPQ